MKEIGRLMPVDLKELWPHEGRDFTTWLAANLDLLGETLGLQLSLVEREASVGDFSADILADDGQGNLVVIENQLGTTDHDHLGKLLTYMCNLDAKIAIWIAREPREEHEKTVHWLNEMLPADTAIYLLRVAAYRIGDSLAAPLFTVIAGPSPQARQTGKAKQELAERHVLRLEFWKQLLERAKSRTPLHARISASKDNWISASAGKSGLVYSYAIRMDNAQVELYIDRPDTEENKRIFDALLARKEAIEAAFGGPLSWQRLDDRRASRIAYLLTVGGLRDRDRWPDIQDAMIDAMIRLDSALKPELQQLNIR